MNIKYYQIFLGNTKHVHPKDKKSNDIGNSTKYFKSIFKSLLIQWKQMQTVDGEAEQNTIGNKYISYKGMCIPPTAYSYKARKHSKNKTIC